MPWKLLGALSLCAFALCAAQILGPLGGLPHVQDEQAYLLQARIFAHGLRVAPSPAEGPLLASEFQELEPAWYGVFPPGWPAVLALGVRAGLAWAVNPLLCAALPWGCWLALRPLLSATATRNAAILAALSPGVLLLGGSWMSHTLSLLCGLLAVAGMERRGPLAAAGGGLALGLLAATRPWDAVLVGLPLGILALVRAGRRQRGLGWLALLGLGVAVPVALLLRENQLLSGDPWVFAVDAYFRDGTDWGQRFRPGCNRLGIGPDRGCSWYLEETGTDLAWTLGNLSANALAFDRLFLGFSGSALLALAGLPALLRRAPALVASGLLVPLGYGLYWYHGVCYGARFWTLGLLAALPASGLALEALTERALPWLWARRARSPALPGGLRAALPLALPLALLGGGLLGTLPEAWRELADRYWCVDATLPGRLAQLGVEDGVILMRDRGAFTARWSLLKKGPIGCDADLSAGAGLGVNDPLGQAPLLWLRWPGASGASELRRRHPGEAIYVLERDLPSGQARLLPWSEEMSGWGPALPLP